MKFTTKPYERTDISEEYHTGVEKKGSFGDVLLLLLDTSQDKKKTLKVSSLKASHISTYYTTQAYLLQEIVTTIC